MAGIPVPLILVMIIWVILHLFLKWTPYGTAIYAIGGNPTAAELSGIPVRRYKTMIYTFSGLMAGIAGILFLARANAAQAVDTIGYEFDSIVAVVVGGTSLMGGKGGVAQTLLGVLLLAAVRNGLNMMGASIYLQLVVVGLILILAYIAENQASSQGGRRHSGSVDEKGRVKSRRRKVLYEIGIDGSLRIQDLVQIQSVYRSLDHRHRRLSLRASLPILYERHQPGQANLSAHPDRLWNDSEHADRGAGPVFGIGCRPLLRSRSHLHQPGECSPGRSGGAGSGSGLRARERVLHCKIQAARTSS